MSKSAAIVSVLGASARLFTDAVLDWHPGTLPMAAETVATSQFLNRLLALHGAHPAARQAQARAVETLDFKPVSSNCNNVVIRVDWEPGAALAETLFIKLPGAPLATRWFCNAIRVWELECNFFRNFANDFPIRLPQVHAIATQRSRFVLLQENLGADPTVQLFTNPDMMKGPPLPLVKRCLSAFATLHAHYNGMSIAARERRLPIARHPFASPVMTEISRFINVRAIEPCRQKQPQRFSEQNAAMYRRAMQHWDTLLAWWYREPLTLVHGDSHLGNFFVDGERMGMLDFQAAHWSKGIRDVQYFLINSVPVEVLAANERELVRYYVEELAAHGVALGHDEAWEQYRAFSFQTLMTIVVSLGLGPLTEKETVMAGILARAVAAVERLEFAQWLDHLVAKG